MNLSAAAPIPAPTGFSLQTDVAGTVLSASPIGGGLHRGSGTDMPAPEGIVHPGGARRATPRAAGVHSRSGTHRRNAGSS